MARCAVLSSRNLWSGPLIAKFLVISDPVTAVRASRCAPDGATTVRPIVRAVVADFGAVLGPVAATRA